MLNNEIVLVSKKLGYAMQHRQLANPLIPSD